MGHESHAHLSRGEHLALTYGDVMTAVADLIEACDVDPTAIGRVGLAKGSMQMCHLDAAIVALASAYRIHGRTAAMIREHLPYQLAALAASQNG